MELGDVVTYSAIATIEYRDPDSGKKTLEFEEKSGTGMIVGVRYKCEGEHVPGHRESDGWDFPNYWVPAIFRVTRRHKFYEVKSCLRSAAVLVHPKHISTGPSKS